MPYNSVEKKKSEQMSEALILAGGCFFAMVSGFVNLVFLEATRMTLSHMTGNVARLSDALYRGSDISVTHFLFVLLAFVSGAFLSGLVIGENLFSPGRRYGYLMLTEAALLLLSFFVYGHAAWLAIYTASFAMGLQNAMASSYHGLIIRTTHMTGILTDMGFLLGAALRKRKILFWKFLFFVLVLAGFFTGGWAGMACYFVFGLKSLLLPSGLLLLAGLIYLVEFSRKSSRQKAVTV